MSNTAPTSEPATQPLAPGRRRYRISRLVPGVMITTLPFTYAGTLAAGFPLKLYEVLFVSWLALLLIEPRSSVRLKVRPRTALLLLTAGLFWLWSVCSIVWGGNLLDATTVLIEVTSWRHQPSIAGLMKSLYVGFAFLVFALFLLDRELTPGRIARAWCMGTLLACAYAWYLWAGSLFGPTLPTLPGQSELQRVTDGMMTGTIRSGTFLEGNFAGAYYVLSTAVAAYGLLQTGRRWYLAVGLLAAATLFTAWSTIAFGAMALVVLGVLLRLLPWMVARYPLRVLGILGVLVAFLLAASRMHVVEDVFLAKLRDDSGGSSRSVRSDQFLSAVAMAQAHPVAGVGIANYGFHYSHYTSYEFDKDQYNPALTLSIPNNVYAEIAAELGLVGLSLFLLLVGQVALMAWRAPRGPVRTVVVMGVASVLIIWNGFPTSTMLFHWVFFALVWKIGQAARTGKHRAARANALDIRRTVARPAALS